MEVTLQVGKVHHHLEGVTMLPPVGTLIVAPQEMTDDGSNKTLEITKHEWQIKMAFDEKDPLKTWPELRVSLLTKIRP